MAQLVTRVDDSLAHEVDALIEEGVVGSRSEAVRLGLRWLVDEHRRGRIAADIVRGYERMPQDEAEIGWIDEATRSMIREEPW